MPSVFVLSTDHGTHPADKWADMISQLVFPISGQIAQQKMLVAKSTQLQIAQGLTDYVQRVIDYECGQLEKDADEHYAKPHDGERLVDAALKIVFGVTDQSPWAQYMRDNEEALRLELTRQFNSIQHVERLYHAELNQHIESASAYRAQFVSGE